MVETGLPNSKDEKYAAHTKAIECGKFNAAFPHWIFVHELAELLRELEPTDTLTPNTAGNLLIERERDGSAGFINLFQNNIEWFMDNDDG